MISRTTLFKALNECSRNLTFKYAQHAAHIAAVGQRIRERLEQSCGMDECLSSPATLFDICHVLETDEDLRVHPDLKRDVEAFRFAVLHAILHDHYEDRRANDPLHVTATERESAIVFAFASALPQLRKNLPEGRFGPETLRMLLPQEVFESLEEYVYDLEEDAQDWSRFTAVLPKDLRERFDAQENGIEVPDVIATIEEANALLRTISDRKGIALDKLLDPAYFVEHCKRMPAFAKVAAFFAAEARKRAGNEQITRDDSPPTL